MLDEERPIYIPDIGRERARGLARLLRQRGVEVRGSTVRMTPGVEALREMGVEVGFGFGASELDGGELVVRLADTADELEALEGSDVEVVDEATILRRLVAGRRTIGVTGTHGKATVSSMVAWILECDGGSPGFLFRGRSPNFGVEARDGDGDWFVLELDEHLVAQTGFPCDYAVCNFLELVPRSYYPEDIVDSMVDFLESNRRLKEAFVNLDCRGNRDLVRRVAMRPTGYGIEHRTEFRGEPQASDDRGISFRGFHRDRVLGEFELEIQGRYNAVNAMGATAVAIRLGISADVVAEALASYEGLDNRYTVASGGGVLMVKDFVGAPESVGRVVHAARQDVDRRLVVVFEVPPETSSSTAVDGYAAAFDSGDLVVVAASTEDPDVVARAGDSLRDEIERREATTGRRIETDTLVDEMIDDVSEGDTVVFFGSDEFLRRADHFQARLAARAARSPTDRQQPRLDGPLVDGDE